MSGAPGVRDKSGGALNGWLQRWRKAKAAPAIQVTVAAPEAALVQSNESANTQVNDADDTGRITRESLLRLRGAGPAPEPEPDLAQQRASFWAAATHDLCQPAQALALFLERLRNLPPQAPSDVLHGYLQSSMDDLTRLLSGLMELAQIDTAEVRAGMTPVSVNDVLYRVREQLLPQAQARGLKLVIRSNGQYVLGDPVLLERILVAVGRNAVQFSAHGTVLFSVRPVRGGAAMRLDVSDSGPGIAERDHRIIFEPFGQRNATNPQGPTRPSLGLYIASRHAALMDTRLELRSALGRGSRFSITLAKVVDRPTDPARAITSALVSSDLSGLRVVLIDSEKALAPQIADWLQSWGCVLVNAQTLQATPSTSVQAIIHVLQMDDPLTAIGHIQSLRGPTEAWIPACVIGPGSERLAIAQLPAETTVLSFPVQAAQLRAWLRRARAR